jgi:DNA polymerase-3 subunit gamma/tau
LYRRYRPRRFDEVRGQDHVIAALRNAVRNESEGHAYLFSGPRGTGKTSTARILAKALNCENLQNGEPCCECTPCVDMEAGRSFDLFELDAASNNGVDAVRDLIERTAVGSPGRTKVYILDEVHMLSPGASNALLKTLEEPPDHVRFVLATTDPQKVLPTIRSRTQHFEFQLLSAQELERQVRWIVADADLDVDDEAIAWVVQKGRGSSRDTLSALDQVVAAGGVVVRAEPVERLYEALVARDTGQAVLAVADALAQGHDPRVLGAAFLDSLRDAFLVSLGVEVPHLMEHDLQTYGRWASELGTPALTRAMEAVGSALVDMRQAADPRVPLEVALVRLTSAQDTSLAGLVDRIERLEQALASGAAAPSPAAAAAPRAAAPAAAPVEAAAEAPSPTPPSVAQPTAEPAAAAARPEPSTADASAGGGGGPAQARAELARLRAARDGNGSAPEPGERPRAARPAPPPVPGAPSRPPAGAAAPAPPVPPGEPAAPPTAAEAPASAEPAPVDPPAPASPPPATAEPSAAAAPAPAPEPASAPPSEPSAGAGLDVDGVAAALEAVLPTLRAPAKAACLDGRFVRVDGQTAVYELGLGVPLRHAERFRSDIESALRGHLGGTLVLQMVPSGEADDAATAPRISGGAVDLVEAEVAEGLTIDIAELEDANDVAETGIDRLTKAFPGAVVLDADEVTT